MDVLSIFYVMIRYEIDLKGSGSITLLHLAGCCDQCLSMITVDSGPDWCPAVPVAGRHMARLCC